MKYVSVFESKINQKQTNMGFLDSLFRVDTVNSSGMLRLYQRGVIFNDTNRS